MKKINYTIDDKARAALSNASKKTSVSLTDFGKAVAKMNAAKLDFKPCKITR